MSDTIEVKEIKEINTNEWLEKTLTAQLGFPFIIGTSEIPGTDIPSTGYHIKDPVPDWMTGPYFQIFQKNLLVINTEISGFIYIVNGLVFMTIRKNENYLCSFQK